MKVRIQKDTVTIIGVITIPMILAGIGLITEPFRQRTQDAL